MKRNLLKFGAIAAALMLTAVACQEKVETKIEEKPSIEFAEENASKVVIPAASQEAVELEFTTDFDVKNLMIDAVEGEDWCKAEFAEGNKIIITPNETGLLEAKKAVFEVKELATKSVQIIYKPAVVRIEVSRAAATLEDKECITLTDAAQKNITVPAGSLAAINVPFTANFPIEGLAVTVAEGSDWAGAAFEGNDKLVITPKAEGKMEAKTAKVVIAAKPVTKADGIIYTPAAVEITLSRAAVTLENKEVITLEKKAFAFEAGDVKTLTVAGTKNFANLSVESKGTYEWCEVRITETGLEIEAKNIALDQEGSAEFTIKTSEKEKDNGAVILKPVNVIITVTRPAKVAAEPTLELTCPKFETYHDGTLLLGAKADGATFTVTVTTNQDSWSVVAPPPMGPMASSWYTITPKQGQSGESFTLKINSGYQTNSATITVIAGSINKKIMIQQQPF